MKRSATYTLQGMLLQGIYGFANCTYGAFVVVMLTDYGYSAAFATGLLTCLAVISFASQPVTGYLSDSRFSPRALILMLVTCMVPALLIMPRVVGSLPLVILCMIVMSLCGAQLPGLLDSWVLSLQHEEPSVSYGVCRGTASLTYATGSLLVGGLTAACGHPARLTLGAAAYACLALMALLMHGGKKKEPLRDVPAVPAEKLTTKEAAGLMLKNRSYILLLIVTFLVFFSTNCTTTFLSPLIIELGGDAAAVGTVYSVISYCEVPVMFLMGWLLKRFRTCNVIIFACALAAVRMILTCFASDLTLLLLIQPLEGISYAILWTACITYINQITESRIRSTAVMTFTAVTGSICSIFGSAMGTAILSVTDSARMVFACAAGAVGLGLAVGLYGSFRRIWK
ncbi:MAG: MFS transporter [Oscillospiraceae bacterium]|nr:MFS transporter [Oscillospiraceae bacterium]